MLLDVLWNMLQVYVIQSPNAQISAVIYFFSVHWWESQGLKKNMIPPLPKKINK